MPHDAAAPGAQLLRLWKRLEPIPGGAWVFSRLLGRRIPYTGTLGASIEELSEGRARIRLRDRKRVRNHLGSVHAVALTNLGELAGGLATLTGIPAGVRGIVVRLDTEYLKKARGTLTAEASWSDSEVVGGDGPVQRWIEATVRDRDGIEVARIRALWHLSAS